MTDNFFRNIGKNAREEAKKVARQIANEPAEMLKDTRSQLSITPERSQSETSVMQQVMTGDGTVKDVSSEEEQNIHAQTKSRLSEIEAELRQLRMQREQRGQEWAKEQQTLMGSGHKEGAAKGTPAPLEMPHSVPKGPKGPGAKRKGNTMEQGRTKKG